MPITILDIILLVVMLVSGLLAMIRGFMREILSIAAWATAASATIGSMTSARNFLVARTFPEPTFTTISGFSACAVPTVHHGISQFLTSAAKGWLAGRSRCTDPVIISP